MSKLTLMLFIAILTNSFGELTRHPYLQPTKNMFNNIGVAWRTSESSAGKVWYREKGQSFWMEAEETQNRDKHYLQLQNLKAGTRYEYKVEEAGTIYSFRTSPEDGNIKVGIIADPHVHHWKDIGFGNEDTGWVDPGTGNYYHDIRVTRYKQYRARILAALDHLAAYEPDLLLILGDLSDAYNRPNVLYERGMWELFDLGKNLFPNTIVCPIPGNHDWQDLTGEHEWADYTGATGNYQLDYYRGEWYLPDNGISVDKEREMQYSFDYGKCHFSMALVWYFWPTQESINWIKADLMAAKAGNAQDFIFLCQHQQPYQPSGTSTASPRTNADFLVDACANYDVDINFFGHRHRYYRTYPLLNNNIVTTKTTNYTHEDKGTIFSMIPSLQYSLDEGILSQSLVPYYDGKTIGFAEMTIQDRVAAINHFIVGVERAAPGEKDTTTIPGESYEKHMCPVTSGDSYTIDKSGAPPVHNRNHQPHGSLIEGERFDAFPNPFNMQTFIPFSETILFDKHTECIYIFNIAGQVVKTINLKHLNKGKKGVFWNGADNRGNKVKPGVYFYGFDDNDTRQTWKKLMVLE
ncbi:MAG: metallophosphoesterase [bacterium]